jgi:hypothetical protein
MSNESDNLSEAKLDAAEMAAAHLVSHVKALRAADIDLHIVDESCMWVVTVKRFGILESE